MRAYERLINYTKFESASDANSKSCPSTKSQLVFGEYLVNEMTQIGIKNAFMDKHGYVSEQFRQTCKMYLPSAL